MKIGIHPKNGSFSDYWIEYCEHNAVPYKLINCYDNNIIDQVRDCDIIMWHYHHANYRDVLFAKGLLFALEQSGKKVFPNFRTAWHFDDKLGQKYLLESIDAPLVPSYIFYDKTSALLWANQASYPQVFKLRSGAGSSNVRLINSKSMAVRLIHKSFGKGFLQYDKWNGLFDRINKFRQKKATIKNVMGGIVRAIKPKEFERMSKKEKGYFYVQEYIPNNKFDIRIIVINNKAFAIKRMVRAGDFRASGSGTIFYEKENFNNTTLKTAFNVANSLQSQCCAFDFVYDQENQPLIVEVSFGFTHSGYNRCVGYWNNYLEFFEGPFNPYGWMIDNLIKD
jgi:glutathione synthase/RimK-type ligase-like ATP-grasp enzyme